MKDLFDNIERGATFDEICEREKIRIKNETAK